MADLRDLFGAGTHVVSQLEERVEPLPAPGTGDEINHATARLRALTRQDRLARLADALWRLHVCLKEATEALEDVHADTANSRGGMPVSSSIRTARSKDGDACPLRSSEANDVEISN